MFKYLFNGQIIINLQTRSETVSSLILKQTDFFFLHACRERDTLMNNLDQKIIIIKILFIYVNVDMGIIYCENLFASIFILIEKKLTLTF